MPLTHELFSRYAFRWLAAFVLGAVSVLGFAPFALGPVLLLTLLLWLPMLQRAASPRAAAGLGYAFGLGLMGFGVFWLRNSIGQFGGISGPLALVATLAFAAFIALYFALFAGLLRWLGRGLSALQISLLLTPALWFVIEWLRGWLFTGFPWLSFGYAQIDWPLAGFAPWLGVFGVGYLLLLSVGLLQHWRRAWALPLLVAIWLAGWASTGLKWTEAAGEPIQVALVQGNIAQDKKWQRRLFDRHLATYLQLTAQATEQLDGVDLVVWPETALAGFERELEADVLQPLQRAFASEGRDLLTGIVAGDIDSDYYNALISLGASGRDAYYKRHLVPLGEYLPLEAILRPVFDFIQIPMSDFAMGGDAKPLLQLAGQPVGVDICYEDAFASEVMRALPEATVLINVSNDAWFGDSLAPHQHLEIARMRALEAQRPFLRATNTGVSAIIGPRGDLIQAGPQFAPAVLVGEVQPLHGLTPYARLGDWPLLWLAGLFAVWLGWRNWRGA